MSPRDEFAQRVALEIIAKSAVTPRLYAGYANETTRQQLLKAEAERLSVDAKIWADALADVFYPKEPK